MHGRTDESVTDALDDRELLVASNREPYAHGFDDDGITYTRPAGGLTAALDPIMQELSGTWIAWGSGDADFEVADDGGRVAIPPEDPAYTLRRLHLSERQLSGYYYGYSNQVLWPLCHGMPTRARFEAEFWSFYRDVNRTFAEAIVDSADGADPVVWVHDYQLALVPRLVRTELPDAFLTQFWHVPWPSWDVFRSCPQRRQLLEGLLANDLIAFHSERYCEAFRDCVTAAFDDARIDDEGRIERGGDRTRVKCCPLGIDAEAYADLARSDEAASFRSSFVTEHDLGGRVAVGVDRLDYTKGIPERLNALERLWERHPERRGTFTYVQKGSASRTCIDDYRELAETIERRIAEINDRFGTADWTPIVYTDEHYSRAELTALYRNADVAIVSPVRDGMNLVAKEYVASQLDGDGALVLSEFAGAAEALGDGALVVNPYDVDAFADTIEAALAMPAATRRRRMRTLRERVAGEDRDAWIAAQFAGLDADRGTTPNTPRWASQPVPVWSRRRRLREALGEADGLFLLTDFDGTVADVVAEPDAAELRDRARTALETLADHRRAAVGVISGRTIDDLRERVAVDGAYYAGEHGIEISDGDERWSHAAHGLALDVLPEVRDTLRQRFDDDDGVSVEDKGSAVAVHYRQSERDGDAVLAAVRTVLADGNATDALRLMSGKQVVEVRPAIDWDKGDAVQLLCDRFTPDGESWLSVYVGDDTTDEDAFASVDGYAVAVGDDTAPTAAPYAVSDPDEVVEFVSWLADEGLAALEGTPERTAQVTDT